MLRIGDFRQSFLIHHFALLIFGRASLFGGYRMCNLRNGKRVGAELYPWLFWHFQGQTVLSDGERFLRNAIQYLFLLSFFIDDVDVIE